MIDNNLGPVKLICISKNNSQAQKRTLELTGELLATGELAATDDPGRTALAAGLFENKMQKLTIINK